MRVSLSESLVLMCQGQKCVLGPYLLSSWPIFHSGTVWKSPRCSGLKGMKQCEHRPEAVSCVGRGHTEAGSRHPRLVLCVQGCRQGRHCPPKWTPGQGREHPHGDIGVTLKLPQAPSGTQGGRYQSRALPRSPLALTLPCLLRPCSTGPGCVGFALC